MPSAPGEPGASITLVEAFNGRAVGRGLFSVPIAGVERGFDAVLVGSLRRVRGVEIFTVVEDFIFDDGEVDRLTWVFTRTGRDSWTGVREDTVGTADVVESEDGVRLTYVADVRSRGEVTRLGFSDIIYRGADGRVINDAVVTKFGLPIGTVRFELQPD
ncbi:MAG: DUF3833 domain-containing protein [Hyphomicrobiales bacterium]